MVEVFLQFNAVYLNTLNRSLALLNLENNYRIIVKTRGGGLTGQTGAIQLGLARALCKIDPNYRSTLKLAGLLTRDSRQAERKKYGRKSSKSFTIFKTLIHIPLVIKLVLCQKKISTQSGMIIQKCIVTEN